MLGLALPGLCLLGLLITNTRIQPSISSCYCTNVRDVSVLLLALKLILGAAFDEGPSAFVIESLMLLAFGASWLVKVAERQWK